MPAARSPSKYVALGLIPVAAAVAVGLIVFRVHLEPPTLTRYVDDDADGGAIVLRPGGRYEFEAHPDGLVSGSVAARAFLLRGDVVRPWNPPFTVSHDGVIVIAGPVDDLFAGVPPGRWQVAVAIGRPEVLPTAPNDVLRARHGDRPEAGWHLVLENVRIEGSPSLSAPPEPAAARGMPHP